MTITVHNIAGPSFLTSALVNDDMSGLDEYDINLLDAFKRHLGDWRVVATDEDDGFYAKTTFQGHTFQGMMIGYVCYETT